MKEVKHEKEYAEEVVTKEEHEIWRSDLKPKCVERRRLSCKASKIVCSLLQPRKPLTENQKKPLAGLGTRQEAMVCPSTQVVTSWGKWFVWHPPLSSPSGLFYLRRSSIPFCILL